MKHQKTIQYIELDIGEPTESTDDRTKKILAQIPKGKAIAITDKDLNLPQNKIIVQIMDAEDVPKITRQRRKNYK